MKKLVNILACLVLVLLLTSVSFAKSESKSSVVNIETYVNCLEDSKCQKARQAAAGVAYSAIIDCSTYGATSTECTTANDNADRSKGNAEYVCSVFPDGPATAEQVATNYLLRNKQIVKRLKTSNLKLLNGNAS